jgi:hypothetical protein
MKLFLVLLAVLLVLFIVGIGLGARDDSGRKADPADFGWLDSLTQRFRSKVETGALQGPCLSDRSAVLGSAGPCQIGIAPADKEVRTLTLALEQGFEVAFDFQPASGSLNVHAKLRPGREVKLSVPKDGGALTLASCAGSSQGCRVRLD